MTEEITKGSKVALVALSNALPQSMKDQIEALCDFLKEMTLIPVCSAYLYQQDTVRGGDAKEKGEELITFFQNDETKAIFDISGGDIANEVLLYIDFNLIKAYNKPFFGYSDLTTVINAIYTKLDRPSYLYQVRHLIKAQQEAFKETILENQTSLTTIDYRFLQGNSMEGIVVGGNIRCFLKLVGTPFMPDLSHKILLLESLSGDVAKMITFLSQYKQIGAFDKVNGILLGTFMQMQREALRPTIEELVVEIVDNPTMPIAKTEQIGHSIDSKAIIIGKNLKLGL